MTDRIGWGILAAGGIAGAFAQDLAVAGLDAVAVGSRSAQRAEEFGRRHGIPHRHGSYEDLVADPDVDIVYIATPHPGHAPAALLALGAGKHVLVEKPFTMTGAEARQVVALAAERGLLVLEAMWTRFLPHMRRIHDLLDEGALGEVRALIADHNQATDPDPAGRMLARELGGGALLDLGVYPVSFALDLFGPPLDVAAHAEFTATGVDRQTGMLLRHAEGRQSVLTTALDTRGPNRAAILGTAGRIEIDPVWYQPTSFTRYGADGAVVETFDGTVSGRGRQFQALEAERLIRAGETASPLLTPHDSVAVMDALDSIRERIGLTYPGEEPA